MADSADDLLRQAREARKAWLDAPDRSEAEFEAAQDMYRAFLDLDRLLSSGCPLPADWVPAADRTVTDVHLTDQISIGITADDRMPPGTAAMTGADGQVIVMTGLDDGD